jgi:hypothetical protein
MIDANSAAEARDQMFSFIQEVHDIVGRTANEPYDQRGRLLVLEEMEGELKEAWQSFNEDFSWDRVKDAIYGAPDEHLQNHGLYGAQLRAKFNLVRSRIRRYFDGITKKKLLQLIDAMDTVLDSIIAATGMDGAIKEMKDLLRNSVDEEE